jgi:hypothetical protein
MNSAAPATVSNLDLNSPHFQKVVHPHITRTEGAISYLKRVSINISGLGGSDVTMRRPSKVINLLKHLLLSHDLVYVQESHLVSKAQLDKLGTYFEGSTLRGSFSEMTPAQAGVFIIVKNSVTERFDIQDEYSSSTEHGQGRVVSFKLTPKPTYCDILSATRETCFYLQSGSGKLNTKARKAQISEMSSLCQDTPLEFWGGDTNMHDNSLLESFLTGRKLEEVLQPQI